MGEVIGEGAAFTGFIRTAATSYDEDIHKKKKRKGKEKDGKERKRRKRRRKTCLSASLDELEEARLKETGQVAIYGLESTRKGKVCVRKGGREGNGGEGGVARARRRKGTLLG